MPRRCRCGRKFVTSDPEPHPQPRLGSFAGVVSLAIAVAYSPGNALTTKDDVRAPRRIARKATFRARADVAVGEQ
jgi:hypothetical protein